MREAFELIDQIAHRHGEQQKPKGSSGPLRSLHDNIKKRVQRGA